MIHIGYWREDFNSETQSLPMPVAMEAVIGSTSEVLLYRETTAKLRYIQGHLINELSRNNFLGNFDTTVQIDGLLCSIIAYRGFSRCRICGCTNGSKELTIRSPDGDVVVPEGYLHYIDYHHIEIDSWLTSILVYNMGLESPKFKVIIQS